MILDKVKLLEQIAEESGCYIDRNAELKKYTTFKIGGKPLSFIDVPEADVLIKLIKFASANEIKYYVIGKGSNLIVDDEPVNAVFFRITDNTIYLKDDVTIVSAAGVSLSRLCLFALENGLSGLEFAYGIPGSVGGAVFMNAGAYGGEINDVICSAEVISAQQNKCKVLKNEMDLSYRHSRFMNSHEIILSAEFLLEKGNKTEIKNTMDELMDKRRSKQPLDYPSAGSTFKRPEGSFASLLIDQCGLKGFSVGDAEVSTKHSGFVVNKGNAGFDDLMKLIGKVKEIVKEKTGYILECEPEIISDREEY